MSARDIINRVCIAVNYTCDHTYASAVMEALTAAGYRILGPEDIDPITVERCARLVDCGCDNFGCDLDEAAERVRSLSKEGGEE